MAAGPRQPNYQSPANVGQPSFAFPRHENAQHADRVHRPDQAGAKRIAAERAEANRIDHVVALGAELSKSQRFVGGNVPERFVEVDAARLLLILHHFSTPCDDQLKREKFFPQREVERHFTPEYYLQKLDFLVRYPGYFAYEIIELHRLKIASASNPDDVRSEVRSILTDREPELRTQPFRRFWYGAHERLNEVEAWWHARGLVFVGIERRRDGKPQKHYFLTPEAGKVADGLVKVISHARWYDDRIRRIRQFFGTLSANDIRNLQYSHPTYRDAQLARTIPDLPIRDVIAHYEHIFGERLALPGEATDVA